MVFINTIIEIIVIVLNDLLIFKQQKLERESSILKNWWNEVYKVHYWAELNHISQRTYSSSTICGKV